MNKYLHVPYVSGSRVRCDGRSYALLSRDGGDGDARDNAGVDDADLPFTMAH